MSYDLDELRARLRDRVEDVVEHLYGDCQLKKVGGNLFAGNITGAPSSKGGLGSFCITLKGEKRGFVRDFGSESDKRVSLIDCWMVRRELSFGDAVREAAEFVGLASTSGDDDPIRKIRYREAPQSSLQTRRWAYPEECLPRTLLARKSRLKSSSLAMRYLKDCRQLTEETIDEFNLGVDCPEKIFGLLQSWRKSGKQMPDENFGNIVFPLRGIDGKFYDLKSYLAVPGMAEAFGLQKSELKAWGDDSGLFLTYFSQAYDGHPYLFVCEGPKDVWRHYQALKQFGYEKYFLIVSSTAGSAFPMEFERSTMGCAPMGFDGFLDKFKLIILAQDNDEAGEKMANRWVSHANRTCLRMRVPLSFNSGKPGADWTDFWNNGGDLAAFRELFAHAPQLTPSF